MTNEEKKEFEEFLKWKAERAAEKEMAENCEENDSSDHGAEIASQDFSTSDKTSLNNNHSNDGMIGKNGWIILIIVVLALVAFLVLAAKSGKKEPNHSTVIEAVDSMAGVEDHHSSLDNKSVKANSKKNIKTWVIKKEKDPMNDSQNIWASIISENYFDDGFMGSGYCSVVVRYMKKYGYDAIISLSNGQIYGNQYNNDNYVIVRFDDAAPIKYWFNEAADGSSSSVFIRKKSDFIAWCKKAKSIKVEVPIFQHGRQIFNFAVSSPLVWPEK